MIKYSVLMCLFLALLTEKGGALTEQEKKMVSPEMAKLLEDNEKDHPLPSKKLVTSKVKTVAKLINNTKKQMIYISGGSFLMGPNKEHNRWISGYNQPRHKVTLSSYYMNKYLVTFGEYDQYTKIKKLPWLEPDALRFHSAWRSPTHPAQGVTWYQAKAYCNWLAKKSGLAYDLPTEAQWEYAARNRGQDIDWSTNDGTFDPGRNTPDYVQMTHQQGQTLSEPQPLPVGSFPPNPLGIYDMAGSVAQWAKNWFYTYPKKPQLNPSGPKKGKNKVIRGGSIKGSTWYQGIYFRDKMKATEAFEGFRCVINNSKPPRTPQTVHRRHEALNKASTKKLYQESIALIKQSNAVADYFGNIVSQGNPSGSITWYPLRESEQGEINVEYLLIGSKHNAKVTFTGINYKHSGWQLFSLMLYDAKSKEALPIEVKSYNDTLGFPK